MKVVFTSLSYVGQNAYLEASSSQLHFLRNLRAGIYSQYTVAATCGFSPETLISQNPGSLFLCLTFCFVLSPPHFSPSSSCQFASSDDILPIDLLSISLSVFGRDLRCLTLSLGLFSCSSPLISPFPFQPASLQTSLNHIHLGSDIND